MELDLVTELETVLDALERAGVETAVCGGMAVLIHGHVRATADIDLLLRGDRATRWSRWIS